MTYTQRCIVAALVFVLSKAVLAAPLPDSTLGTLKLDAELQARGRLGGVAVDRLGFIYVSNFRDSVWKISPEGEVRMLTDSLYGSSGNTIDKRGNLLQANFMAHSITRITRNGEISSYVDEGLSGPVGLVFDNDENLYVCNCQSNTISKVSPNRNVSTFSSGALFTCPNGITLDDNGMLYVVNYSNDKLIRIDEDGNALVFATIPPGGNAHVAFTQDHFYVTKLNNNQIFKVTREGQVSLIAGTGAIGQADGPALSSTLARPNGIAVAVSGDLLYINNLITWGTGRSGPMTLRTLELATLAKAMQATLEENGIEAAHRVYDDFKSDRTNSQQDRNTEQQVSQLAFKLLSSGRWRDAIPVFGWNAASYPNSWRAQNNLGYVNMVTGRTDEAIKAYEQSLVIKPDNDNAKSQLSQLRAKSGQ